MFGYSWLPTLCFEPSRSDLLDVYKVTSSSIKGCIDDDVKEKDRPCGVI